MKIRKAQLEQFQEARMEALRRDGLLALRARGFQVQRGREAGAWLIKDAAGGTARMTSRGAFVSLKTGEGRTFETEQYAHGRIRSITDASGSRVLFERDSRSLLTGIDCGQGRLHRFSHDQSGRLLGIKYPDGTATKSEYNDLGQLTAVTDRNGNLTRYAYNAEGLLQGMTDARGNNTRLIYRGWDLPSVIRYPNGNSHEFRYDESGRLKQMLVNGKPHAQFAINEVPGRHEVKYTDGTWVRLQLDGARLTEAANETVAVRFEYDQEGRLMAEHTGTQTVRYLRNAVGALIGIVTPSGAQLTFTRDSDQRLSGITDWGGRHYRIEQEKAGPPTRIAFPNKTVASWSPSSTGLPSTMLLTGPDSGTRFLESCRWQYDLCDRVIEMCRNDKVVHYRYDGVGRLLTVEADIAEAREAFTLDAKGNRIRDGANEIEYDGADQITNCGPHRFTHDHQGNMTSGVCPKGTADYSYNGGGQLIAAKTPAGLARYAYDAVGRRIRKELGGRITHYAWAGTKLLSETTTDGSTITRRDYLWDPDRAVPYAMRENGETYYLHVGARGEVLCMTDGTGAVVWRADYRAFGNAQVQREAVKQPWRLAGHYFDEETGLHYVVARYFDPALGRFLTVDPVAAEGCSRNAYLYGDGDPLNRSDPTGTIGAFLTGVLIGAAVGAVVGAAIGAGIEMYRQRNQEHFEWGKIGKAALVGGAIGLIGGAVGVAVEAAAVAAVGVVAAGALAGGVGAAVEYCAEVAMTDTPWDWGQFGASVGIGVAIGAVTAGIGGLLAARAARKAAREAAKEAAEKAAREAAEKAAREAEEKAAREAAEKAAKEAEKKAAQEAVNKKMTKLASDGHGPQRHEGGVTEQQLDDRAMCGIDPISGTTTDAVTGGTHKYGKNATKINTPEDYVKGEEHLRNSKEFSDKVAAAESSGETRIVVEDQKLSDIYGPNYKDSVSGKTRQGSKNHPTGTTDTNFTDGTMLGVYDKDPATGEWRLTTMYPEPK